MLQRRRDAIGILRKHTSLVPNSTRPPSSLQAPAQDVERARLQQHPHARIGHVGRSARAFRCGGIWPGRAASARPTPAPDNIGPPACVHFVDDAEVVIDLERARLDALAARAGAMIRRRRIGFDDADGDAAPRQIAGQHQAGRPGAGDQDVYIGQTTLGRRTCCASVLASRRRRHANFIRSHRRRG